MALYQNEAFYLTGQYRDTIDLNPGASTYTLFTNGQMGVWGSYLLKRGIEDVGVSENSNSTQIRMFWNPVTTSFVVNVPDGCEIFSARLVNHRGQFLKSWQNIRNNSLIEIKDIS
jgi:hypothetical protein